MSEQTPQLDPVEPAPAPAPSSLAPETKDGLLRVATVVGCVVGALVVLFLIIGLTGSGRGSNESAYLNEMDKRMSFQVLENRQNKREVLRLGYLVCDTIKSDGDLPTLVVILTEQADLTPKEAGNVMGFAAKYLCPGAAEAAYGH